MVFPTPVGVFPDYLDRLMDEIGLPHTRGGVSFDTALGTTASTSSPHPWGCFHWSLQTMSTHGVFPTPVGVFLLQKNMVLK